MAEIKGATLYKYCRISKPKLNYVTDVMRQFHNRMENIRTRDCCIIVAGNRPILYGKKIKQQALRHNNFISIKTVIDGDNDIVTNDNGDD